VRGLSPHEWSIIDLYEDEFYELATVEAATRPARPCSARFTASRLDELDGDWSPEAFEATSSPRSPPGSAYGGDRADLATHLMGDVAR